MVQEGATAISINQLLEAGAHLGHQPSRWNPRMKRYIFTQRNGIHIIDLQQTVVMLERACAFLRDVSAGGEKIIFVGTKKQAQEAVELEAKRAGAFYVNQRWLGGMLTNFTTIQARIDYLVRLEDRKARGELSTLPKKEIGKIDEKITRLNRYLGGFKEMTALPGAVFIVDPTKERIAITEARKMKIPVVAIADTNCNPDEIDYPIPANDDAIRAVKLVCSRVADCILEGKQQVAMVPEAAAKPGEPKPVAAAAAVATATTTAAPAPAAPPVPPSMSFAPDDKS